MLSSPLLDVNYRQRNLELALSHVESWRASEIEFIQSEAAAIMREHGDVARDEFVRRRTEFMQGELSRLRGDAQSRWGMDFYKGCPGISPLRGALAVWGLDVDDITVNLLRSLFVLCRLMALRDLSMPSLFWVCILISRARV